MSKDDFTIREEADDPLLQASEMGMAPYNVPEYPQQSEPTAEQDPRSHHAIMLPMEEDRISRPKDWNGGLFGCFDSYESCLLGTFCPCISFGRSSKILRTRDSLPLSHPRGLTTMCNPFTALYYAANAFTMGIGGPVISTWRRGHIRQRYGIRGNVLEDVAVHFCCHCCALVQEDQEVQLRETERRKMFNQEQEDLAEEFDL